MNKKGKNTNTFITYLLITFIMICGIFRYKTIFIESNNVLEVSLSNLLYPFTILFIILICKKTNFKEAHKVIIKTALIFLIFNLIISIFNSIPGNYYSRDIDLALKQAFTPNYFLINNQPIYYPNIMNLISFTLLYYFSHTLILILYEAMEPYTKKFIAFSLAMFIPYGLDTLCFVTINDVFKTTEFNKMITNLTSNFVIVIVFTIITTIIFTIKSKFDEYQYKKD